MSLFSKALNGVLVSDNSTQSTRLQKVEELKKALVSEGYQPSEAEHFLKQATGAKKLADLDNKELDIVIERLAEQIKLAQQCKNMML